MIPSLTPLFQLNLLVHLSLPYPKNSFINPYFYRKGYELKKIEFSIPLDSKHVQRLNTICNSNKNVTPEVILYNPKTNEYALFECKVKSFQTDWTKHSTKQAAGYLTLTPEYINNLFSTQKRPDLTSKIYYGVDSISRNELNSTLIDIGSQVNGLIGHSLSHEVLGMLLDDEGLSLITDDNSKIKIFDEEAAKANEILYLIPFDINGKFDDKGKEILKRQIRTTLRAQIGKSIGDNPFSFTSRDVCQRINPVWHQLPTKFQNKIRSLVHSYILEVIKKIRVLGITVTSNSQIYDFPAVQDRERKKLQNFLLSEAFLKIDSDSFNNSSYQISMEDII